MFIYSLKKPVTLASGTLLLEASQAQPREKSLTHLKENQYEILKKVQFKAGEKIGYSGRIDKDSAELTEDLNTEPAQEDESQQPEPEITEGTEGFDIEEVEAIEAGTLMAMLGLNFHELKKFLSENYETMVGKKADLVPGDIFRKIAEEYELGEVEEESDEN